MIDDPIDYLKKWLKEESIESMALSTVDENNFPDSRMVLLKKLDHNGLVFFTNYESKKALQLANNNKAALLFYWHKLERQVRIKGLAYKTSYEESSDYFKTRPRGAQIGAWASRQSKTLENKENLLSEYKKYEELFLNREVTCPTFWGGYLLRPISFEFFKARENRLHERLLYEKDLFGKYEVKILYP